MGNIDRTKVFSYLVDSYSSSYLTLWSWSYYKLYLNIVLVSQAKSIKTQRGRYSATNDTIPKNVLRKSSFQSMPTSTFKIHH